MAMASDDVGGPSPEPDTPAIPTLVVDRKDPLAWAVRRTFSRQPLLLFVVMLAVGIICLYDLPLINGTFWPDPARLGPNFDVASTDVYSQLVWFLLLPIAGIAYLRQLDIIPQMFDTLFDNGVTGLSREEYRQFLEETDRQFNTPWWFIGNIAIFGPLWALFVLQTARAPFTWYHAESIWPWVIYFTIEFVENVAGISFPARHFVATRRLKRLMKSGAFHPQLLHPDGMCGCAPIVGFVLNGLVFGGAAFLVLVLQFANTLHSEPGFLAGAGPIIYLAGVIIYAFGVPYLLFGPLRMVIRNFRQAKQGLLVLLSTKANSAIWEPSRSGPRMDLRGALYRDTSSLLDALRTFGESVTLVETIPQTIREALFGARARSKTILSTILPPVTSLTAFMVEHRDTIARVVGAALSSK